MISNFIQNFETKQNGQKNIFRALRPEAESAANGAVIDVLKSAYQRLKRAEQDIAQKEARIADLETLLTTDELTGLINRRGFIQNFQAELERVQRTHNQGGLLVMIDLDGFKAINDTYGHNAGDEALRVVGRFLKGSIRAMDCAARLGGDEFVLLLANTSIAQAMERARAIGNALNAVSFGWQGTRIEIGGSLGLQEFGPNDTLAEVMALADAGMYDDKAARRG